MFWRSKALNLSSLADTLTGHRIYLIRPIPPSSALCLCPRDVGEWGGAQRGNPIRQITRGIGERKAEQKTQGAPGPGFPPPFHPLPRSKRSRRGGGGYCMCEWGFGGRSTDGTDGECYQANNPCLFRPVSSFFVEEVSGRERGGGVVGYVSTRTVPYCG